MARASDAILSAVPDEFGLEGAFPDIALISSASRSCRRIGSISSRSRSRGRSAPRSPPPASPRRPGAPAMSTRSSLSRSPARFSSRAGPGISAPSSRSNGWSWFRARDAVGYGSSGWPRPDAARAIGAPIAWIGWTAFERPPAGQLAVWSAARRHALPDRREGGPLRAAPGRAAARPWRRRSWRACVADLPSRTAGYNAARPPVPSARSRDASRVAGATVRTDRQS